MINGITLSDFNSFSQNLDILIKSPLEIEHFTESKRNVSPNIVIWDVCHTAKRKGSLDSAIKNEVPNKINELIELNPSIRTIAFNGQKASKLYSKYLPKFDNINYTTLLSTSPANAKYSFEEKLKDWSKIRKIVETATR